MGEVEVDVVVAGSGGAGVFAAIVAHDLGLRCHVVEHAPVLGGTTAVSGGLVWIPCNPLMSDHGYTDSEPDALAYLAHLTMGRVEPSRLESFVKVGPEVVRYLLDRTPVRLKPVGCPDYHPEWPGASLGGRSLDNLPFDAGSRPELQGLVREGTHFPLITYEEFEEWRRPDRFDWELVAERMVNGVRTMGGALAAALIAGALERGVPMQRGVRARSLVRDGGRVTALRCETHEGELLVRARRGVVLATGGFEWNESLKNANLRGPTAGTTSPPWNTGDGIVMAMAVGAAVENLSEANWAPTFHVPGEEYDEHPLTRLASSSLALPGAVLVNPEGRRFVNESMNYYDQGRGFHQFDTVEYRYKNIPSWMVFDARYKRTYAAAGVMPSDDAPSWIMRGGSFEELASAAGIDPAGLGAEMAEFNRFAAEGDDPKFGRGRSAYDRFNGDPDHGPNSAIGPLAEPPFYAVPITLGISGTKGGLRTDEATRVLDAQGRPIDGLYAVGSASASLMGASYAGSGGNLGPGLVEGYLAATAIGGR